jgi:hypothetical protein
MGLGAKQPSEYSTKNRRNLASFELIETAKKAALGNRFWLIVRNSGRFKILFCF